MVFLEQRHFRPSWISVRCYIFLHFPVVIKSGRYVSPNESLNLFKSVTNVCPDFNYLRVNHILKIIYRKVPCTFDRCICAFSYISRILQISFLSCSYQVLYLVLKFCFIFYLVFLSY